jgi:pimeloyl-ACP methyl ester carboxylesterase
MPTARLCQTPLGARSLTVAGIGTPTVVFESGAGDGKEAWSSVFNAICAETRAVAYDRAGYGDSERSKERRDGLQIVSELRAMLRAENIAPPYVLVGHALGGTFAKLFARTYPKEVAGVVLVEARHSIFVKRCRKMGVPRLLYEPPIAMRKLASAAMRGELAASPVTIKQVRAAGSFPAVPLIALTRRKAANHWLGGVARAWTESQRSLANLSVLGRVKVCEYSGYHMHKDRPEVVVSAVVKVLTAARYMQANNKPLRPD